MTPSSARTSRTSVEPTRPNTDGPMMMPAMISPTTGGTLIRSAISAATLAATRTMRMSRRISATDMRYEVVICSR